MILKQVVDEIDAIVKADGVEAPDPFPVVVDTPTGQRLAVVGVSIEHSRGIDRIVLATAGARELGLEPADPNGP